MKCHRETLAGGYEPSPGPDPGTRALRERSGAEGEQRKDSGNLNGI